MIDDLYYNEEECDLWWREPEGEDMATAIFATVQAIDRDQEHRQLSNLHHLRLYSNRLASGLSGEDYSLMDDGERIKLNVIKSVIDAAASQIASNQQKVMHLTTGGNRKQITRAKRLNKYVAGQFRAVKQRKIALKVFFDAAIFGTGFEHVFSEKGRIKCERVFPNDIIVNDAEARDGSVRQMFRHMEVSREVAMEKFGTTAERKSAIEDAELIRRDTSYRTSNADMMSIVQAWHLPSGPDADDGWTAIACSGTTLEVRKWKRDTFPIVSFRVAEAPLGYWGIGFAEELTSIQIEINYLAQKIQTLMNLATTQLWKKKGEGVGKIDNEDMGTRTYKNTPPVAIPIKPAAVEFYQHMWELFDRAFAITGVSQLAAQSQKPAGLNSGEALRVYNDIGSRRFQHVGGDFEDFHVAVGDCMIAEASDILERDDSAEIKVLAAGDKDVEEISFKDVQIDRDKYISQPWPASILPDTPAGKLQTVTEISQVNPEIGAHAAMLLTGVPDLEAVVSRINAPYELVDLYLTRMIDDGEYDPPLPYMDLAMAQRMAQLELLRAHKDGVEEERLELLRRFMDECAALQEAAAMAAAPPPMQGMPGDIDAGSLPGAMPASIPGGPAAGLQNPPA
jgi:hypothetical protein